MAARQLTDRFCESVKPIEGRQVAYPDTKSRGLELRVSGDGKKAWYFLYRTRDGAQRRLKVGDFPTLDLKRARDLTDVRRGEVAAGADPASDGSTSPINMYGHNF